MRKLQGILIAIVVLMLTLAACSPADVELPQTGGDVSIPPDAALMAQDFLAEELGVNVEEVEIIQVEQQEWPNACLGLPEQDEICAEVATPGFVVNLRVNEQDYTVRTDQLGEVIRIEEPNGAETEVEPTP